eukprot:COSAG01_NODE_27692_length_679_cov_1.146552_2_plen_129_part_00
MRTTLLPMAAVGAAVALLAVRPPAATIGELQLPPPLRRLVSLLWPGGAAGRARAATAAEASVFAAWEREMYGQTSAELPRSHFAWDPERFRGWGELVDAPPRPGSWGGGSAAWHCCLSFCRRGSARHW